MNEKLKKKINVGALSVRNTEKNLPNCAQKGNKGITLVALIITIIVLLILAVVAIRAVQGDGIISKAKEAQTKYEEAQTNEQAKLSTLLEQIEDETTNKTLLTLPDAPFSGSKLYFEEGMTWNDWVESEYNVDGWYIANGYLNAKYKCYSDRPDYEEIFLIGGFFPADVADSEEEFMNLVECDKFNFGGGVDSEWDVYGFKGEYLIPTTVQITSWHISI